MLQTYRLMKGHRRLLHYRDAVSLFLARTHTRTHARAHTHIHTHGPTVTHRQEGFSTGSRRHDTIQSDTGPLWLNDRHVTHHKSKQRRRPPLSSPPFFRCSNDAVKHQTSNICLKISTPMTPSLATIPVPFPKWKAMSF